MADNTFSNERNQWATDEISGAHFQKVKLVVGADDTATDLTTDNPLPIRVYENPLPPYIFAKYASLNGLGVDNNANKNYSEAGVGAQEFRVAPTAGVIWHVTRMIVSVYDTTGMTAQEYGNTGGELSNGIEVKIKNGSGTINDLTDGVPVKFNAEWGALCYDVDVKTWGSGNELLVARWTFALSGAHIKLDGDLGEYLSIDLSDDLTGLLAHRFMLQGHIGG